MDSFDRDKIIARIIKMKAQAEGTSGTTEAEAQAFAAKMQEMILRHKIHEDELKAAGNKPSVEPIVEEWFRGKVVNCPSRPEGAYHANRVEWVEELAHTIAEAHYCKILVRVGNSSLLKKAVEHENLRDIERWSAGVGFVGRISDATSALATFEVLMAMMVKLGCRAYFEAYGKYVKGQASWQRGFYRSWMLGFSARLRERYEEELGKFDTELRQLEPSKAKLLSDGVDIPGSVESCSALVRIAKEAEDVVEEYFDAKRASGKLGFARRVGVGAGNVDAYGKGRAAADSVKLRADERLGSGSKGLLR